MVPPKGVSIVCGANAGRPTNQENMLLEKMRLSIVTPKGVSIVCEANTGRPTNHKNMLLRGKGGGCYVW